MDRDTKRRIWWTSYEAAISKFWSVDDAHRHAYIVVLNSINTADGKPHVTMGEADHDGHFAERAQEMAREMLTASSMSGGVNYARDRRYC